MMERRMKGLAVICLFAIAILLGRLAQIQLIETESFSKRNTNLLEESVRQRTQEVVIDHGRGKFFDRKGVPLTTDPLPVLILFPFLKQMDWDAERVAEIIGTQPEKLYAFVEEVTEPEIFGDGEPLVLKDWQTEQINRLEIPGVYAVQTQFERPVQVASQLIGIVGENRELLKKRYPERNFPENTVVGITGLQKSFDEFLIQEEQTKLVYHVDGRGGPLFGIDVKYVNPSNPFYPVKIITTLDDDIQRELEQIADDHGMERGGILLLDIESNSILANVSRPKTDEKNPFRNDGSINTLFTAQYPGSVFKTVIAAAAIDRKLIPPSRTFDCSKTIRGEEDPVYDHGILDFQDSFAVSCNNTFATLAKELAAYDPALIETYAKEFGLLDRVGWQGNVFHIHHFRQLADEQRGQIFLSDTERKDPQLVALAGIGQHNVKITPLAVANMMATIARGGERYPVRAVSAIEYKSGSRLFSFPKEEGKWAVSRYTAKQLQQLLREVVTNERGTGRGLQDLPYEVAGKTGTAETERYAKGTDGQYLNKWFAGYFPFGRPKYALVVVNLDVLSHTGSPIPVTRDVVNFLYEYEK